ncbi:MAG: alpha-galactosidase [Clostridiales bacterium]|nr:alpha-galactosidase [Clostridiales bacterium]
MQRQYENPAASAWFADVMENPERFPFRFTCGGTAYRGFGAPLVPLDADTQTEGAKTVYTRRYRASETLVLILRAVHYADYGASEWTVWFENPGKEDSGILTDVCSELTFGGAYPMLKGILGDHVCAYRPYAMNPEDGPIVFTSNSGRATHVNFPYFNLECGDGGVLLAIGWAGTWTAEFRSADEKTSVLLRSVNNLRTRLKPGERIRTALFATVPYAVRDEAYATNCWRSWFMKYNLPKADGAGTPLEPFSTCCLSGDTGLPNSDGSISERHFTWRRSMEKMLAEDIRVDFRWMDAGWYAAPDNSSPEVDWWGTVGTWTFDPAKWPGDTFRESTDFARENGMKTLLWFEPERVTNPEALAENYGYDTRWAIRREGVGSISNNIGDPDCYRWTLGKVTDTLRKNRVEMYREDNNSDPAGLWKHLDAIEGEDRAGITECRFIDAHYRMWDDIIACTTSFGGCGFVDSCASGGGRNDLESMRRGVPLLRSDADRTWTSLRLSMTWGFNRWIPFCGASTKESAGQLEGGRTSDVYIWRASYLPVLNVSSSFVMNPDQNFSPLREGIREWKSVRPYLLKEFYPLTPWHAEHEKTGFTAFAYYDPDKEEGVLLAFRQEDCDEAILTTALPFEQDASWSVRDADTGEENTVSGEFTLAFEKPRTARLFFIRRA